MWHLVTKFVLYILKRCSLTGLSDLSGGDSQYQHTNDWDHKLEHKIISNAKHFKSGLFYYFEMLFGLNLFKYNI